MEPIINQFTKNLSGCSGCGQVKPINKGEKVTFIVQVQIEADSGKAAANKIPDECGIVIGVTKMNTPQQITNASQFQRTSTQPVPAQ